MRTLLRGLADAIGLILLIGCCWLLLIMADIYLGGGHP